MKTTDFDYELPPELVAGWPLDRRDMSRLLRLEMDSGAIGHFQFRDLPDLLKAGDCLVINNSRVIRARLVGRRPSGGRAEILLISPDPAGGWRALVSPGRKLEPGGRVEIGPPGDPYSATVVILEDLGEGVRRVEVNSSLAFEDVLERHGQVPLPPYILAARRRTLNRSGDELVDLARPELIEETDASRYQTVYAEKPGSVAAPTAGLHFTPDLMQALKARRIEIREVTLHVGAGTFLPVKAENPLEHPMHSERYSITRGSAEAIEAARRDPKRRVIAIGTTSVRVLETAARDGRPIEPGEAETDLLILPGHRFHAVDGLVTNFHLPQSTLLMLVCALAGRDHVMAAYRDAVERRYRFYSYGDAMLIV